MRYKLPTYSDPEGGPVKVAFPNKLPQFMSYDDTSNEFTIVPMVEDSPCKFMVNITITDGFHIVPYNYTLIVWKPVVSSYMKSKVNSLMNRGAPEFTSELKEILVYSNKILEFQLPAMSDPDNDLIITP